MKSTAFLYDEAFLAHETGPDHPECPERLISVLQRLGDSGTLEKLRLTAPAPASRDSIERLHSPTHVDHVAQLSDQGGLVAATPDTVASPNTYRAALLAAGAVQTAVRMVAEGDVPNAFCAVRPPGHHAEQSRPMGFCFFNNVAVGARYAQENCGLKRIAIVDWDVHHGNGTQHLFEEDPSVLFFSIHQYPHYPGTGGSNETGFGPGAGLTVNVPVPAGVGDAEYAEIFRNRLKPAIERFEPDLILISAGFDAHQGDPLGSIHLTDDGFALLTEQVMEMALAHCDGRLVSVLEGGYALDLTAGAVQAHIQKLLNSSFEAH